MTNGVNDDGTSPLERNNVFVHITTAAIWEQIQVSGGLSSPESRGGHTNQDSKLISAFFDLNLDSREFTLRLLRTYVGVKNGPLTNRVGLPDLVILLIQTPIPGVSWSRHPGQHRELITFGGGHLLQEDFGLIGGYAKTADKIPLTHVKVFAWGPPEPETITIPASPEDDEEYVDWLLQHPEGFVVNVTKTLSPGYFVLHRATCPTIHPQLCGHEYEAGAFTQRSYRKFVAVTVDELRAWGTNGPFKTIKSGCHCMKDVR